MKTFINELEANDLHEEIGRVYGKVKENVQKSIDKLANERG